MMRMEVVGGGRDRDKLLHCTRHKGIAIAYIGIIAGD